MLRLRRIGLKFHRFGLILSRYISEAGLYPHESKCQVFYPYQGIYFQPEFIQQYHFIT